jgi:adenylate cyclase
MATPSLIVRVARLLTRPLGFLTERLGSRFYLILALLVVAGAVFGIGTGLTDGIKSQAFDTVMRNRFRSPPPDPALIIVDVDEASLAAMAPEFGRWPWPRSLMAELVEGLARVRPAAIVFDIAFSDLDRSHPEADLYLRQVAEQSPETFFAMIRLNPDNDLRSELRLAWLAGVEALPEAHADATAAMIVPYFFDVLDGRRLGTINLYADDDGLTRSYHVYRDAHGWRIYSLPANVSAALGVPLPDRQDILLNWRGPPPAYPTVSFHTLYDALLRGDPAPVEQFRDRIVVVGSSAPSLFDIRPTPLSSAHTGVEVLTTAIDNLRNRDHLTELPDWIYMLVTAASVAILALAFRSNVDWLLLRMLFTVTQVSFVFVMYLVLNYSTWFVDLTIPFTAAFAYFVAAGIYARAVTLRRNGHPWFSAALDAGQTAQVLLLACRVSAPPGKRRRVHGILQRHSGLTRYGAAAPRLFGAAPLMEKLYEDIALFYWLMPPERAGAGVRDLFSMLDRSLDSIERLGADARVRFALHSTVLTIDERGEWESRGKEAFMAELTLAQRPKRPQRPIEQSDEFAAACRECQVIVPPRLARAGLATGSAVAAG